MIERSREKREREGGRKERDIRKGVISQFSLPPVPFTSQND